MASPVGNVHSKEHVMLITWLGIYQIATPGVEALATPTVILGKDCEPQPDAALRLLNGKTKLVRRGKKRTEYVSGPPELIAEAASSSESIDLSAKRRDYERYGVDEYLAFLVRSRKVIWHVRHAKKFVEMPTTDGILRSRVFPGLWLDPAALLKGDMKRVQEVLNSGIATSEHAAFIAELSKRKA